LHAGAGTSIRHNRGSARPFRVMCIEAVSRDRVRMRKDPPT
jgi:hypothetical protein